MTRCARQAGFTVLELMVALSISSILMLALFGLYFQDVQEGNGIISEIRVNNAARRMFNLLLFGGARPGAPSLTDPFNDNNVADATTGQFIPGLISRKDGVAGFLGAPTEDSDTGTFGCYGGSDSCLMAQDGGSRNYVLALGQGKNSGTSAAESVMSEWFSKPVSIRCTAAADPLPDCAAAGSVITMSGYLRSDPFFNKPAAPAGVRELVLPVIDPVGITNPETTPEDVSAVYWTAFSLRKEI